MQLRRGACLVFGLITVGSALTVRPRRAQATEVEVGANTQAQFYTLQSPWGDPLIRRRRYTQTLTLGVYDIGGDFTPETEQLSFKARLRMDADLGQNGQERDPNNARRYVPGLAEAPLDVMYAYLEGRRYFGGLVGFRLGRQYQADALGWWSFDGGLLRLDTPAHIAVETYGGFEQRGGLPMMLGTPRYSADGVLRGDRADLDANQVPYFLEEERLAPAFGFALESTGLSFLSARLTYRKVINRDTVLVSPFERIDGGYTTVGGDRVSTERAGGAARLSIGPWGALSGSAVYDFYNQMVSERGVSADWYATEQLTLGADYEYYYPTFDADSIFNWFSHRGMTTLLGRGAFAPSRRFGVQLAAGVKRFETEGDSASYQAQQLDPNREPDREVSGRLHDLVTRATGSLGWAAGRLGLASMAETGRRGHRVGGDVSLRQTFENNVYDALLVLSLYDWDDAIRPDRSATSLTTVIGGGYSPLTRTRMGVELEHSMNRLVGQRYRVVATLDLTVLE